MRSFLPHRGLPPHSLRKVHLCQVRDITEAHQVNSTSSLLRPVPNTLHLDLTKGLDRYLYHSPVYFGPLPVPDVCECTVRLPLQGFQSALNLIRDVFDMQARLQKGKLSELRASFNRIYIPADVRLGIAIIVILSRFRMGCPPKMHTLAQGGTQTRCQSRHYPW